MNTEMNMKSTAARGFDYYRSSSILYGILELASERHQNNQCHRELQRIHQGVLRKEIWAMKGNYEDIVGGLADMS